MTGLDISSSQISQIIDDPALLHTPASVGISQDTATEILYHGYTKGFSSLFIMDACLTVFATLVSVVMIKHKELSRGDEEMLRQQAIKEGLEKKMGMASGAATPKDSESGVAGTAEGVEMGRLPKEPEKGGMV
jgi:hypothetical protein